LLLLLLVLVLLLSLPFALLLLTEYSSSSSSSSSSPSSSPLRPRPSSLPPAFKINQKYFSSAHEHTALPKSQCATDCCSMLLFAFSSDFK
jgi:hypothetical protein